MSACDEDGDRFDLPVDWTQRLLLDLATERKVEGLFARIVERFAALPDLALARIWVIRPGDCCDVCPMREECARNIDCLHLVASAGNEPYEAGADWSRLDGDFRRFPIGRRKVGRVAETAEAIWVEDTRESSKWIAHPEWAEREGILGFGGQPLVYKGEVLGVIGVFTRRVFCPVSLAALRVIADHAAAALANARAWEEIETLRERITMENEILRSEIDEVQSFGEILGGSAAIRKVGEKIEQVAPTDATVLILGESGTGKELVAREIHRRSRRSAEAMIRVNCASIPRELFESEFFGHEKGAFTGALKERLGRFCAANGGTLFLDEVGEIPLELQSKLLRVLQEGQFERVGGDRTHSVDVRIIGATNVDLEKQVAAGRFREDLYYRLNVFPVEVPPLRDRLEDVATLADHFAERAEQKFGRAVRLSEADHKRLSAYSWPGNVRELQNVIERSAITARGDQPRFDDLGRVPVGVSEEARRRAASADPDRVLSDAEMRERDRENLRRALDRAGGRISGDGGVAELLGLKPSTVASRIQKYGLKPAAAR